MNYIGKMTPKEKAKELVDKYILDGLLDKYMGICSAKKSALICVDEILDVLNNVERIQQHPIGIYKAQDYWKEVKNEIEKQDNN